MWGLFEWVSAYFAARSLDFEKLVAGKETVLVEEGKISRAGLRAAMLSEGAVRSLLRIHKIKNPEEVREATLEPSRKPGIVPHRQPEPS